MLFRTLSILIGYTFGCIQSAEIIQRIKKLPGDIRQIGTGNPGTANMTGQFGAKAGFATLFMDMGKAILSIFLCQTLFFADSPSMVTMYAGLGIIAGHCWPVHRRFKGGRGIACLHGIALMLGWIHFALILLGELLGAVISRLMIGGALGAAFIFPISLFLLDYPLEEQLLGLLIWGMIMLRHASKFKSIAQKEEPAFSFSSLQAALRKK